MQCPYCGSKSLDKVLPERMDSALYECSQCKLRCSLDVATTATAATASRSKSSRSKAGKAKS